MRSLVLEEKERNNFKQNNMKTTIVSESKKEEASEFPCIKRGLGDDGVVVLFTSKTTGMVIVSGEGYYVGYYNNDWLNFDNNKMWREVSDITINFKM